MNHNHSLARDSILEAIITWAQECSLARTLILTGSLARQDDLIDDLSDIDVEIISADPAELMASNAWLSNIGSLITVLVLDPSPEQRWATRLAIYTHGVKVDFTLAGLERIKEMVAAEKLDPLYERGYQVLVDKDGTTNRLPRAMRTLPTPTAPSQDEFNASVEEFWFEAFHVPKYLIRNELWLVKNRDRTMKDLLLRMLEWHATNRNNAIDTWHIGTRLSEWVDAQTLSDICKTYGRFDKIDAVRAFEETTLLYSRLGREAAEAMGLTYPRHVEEKIMEICRCHISGIKCNSG
jgi:aminoglycoside 6-adenylyltransferase